MPVSDENLGLYLDLQTKSQALSDYILGLIDMKTIANEAYINIKKERAEFELVRVGNILSFLDSNRAINFPSGDQLEEMARTVAALQAIVARSHSVTELIEAGDAVVAAWPVA